MTSVHHTFIDDIRLTRSGQRALTARALLLRDEIIPDLESQRVNYPREETIRFEAERAVGELARIVETLATAQPAEAIPDDPQVVELGEIVTIRLEGLPAEHYVVVHPCEESRGVGGRTSSQSPLGRALLGRRIGDEVEVLAPGGTYRCIIEGADRPEPTCGTGVEVSTGRGLSS